MAKKILIVEDEPDLLTVTTFRLRKAGYEIFIASNGKEALDFIQKNTPDLMLLDLLLPTISGYEVCKQIKSNDKFKSIPVILFTASALSVVDKAKDVGADDFIMKPFEPEELLQKIKKLIG